MSHSADDLVRRSLAHVWHPCTQMKDHEWLPLVPVERGEGAWLIGPDGKRYLDAMAGLWCVNVGYGREEIADALADQARKLSYFHGFSSMATEPAAILAERVISKAPGTMSKAFFGASGSDANDTQVKLVWYYNNVRGQPAKKKIIARDRGYHGITSALFPTLNRAPLSPVSKRWIASRSKSIWQA